MKETVYIDLETATRINEGPYLDQLNDNNRQWIISFRKNVGRIKIGERDNKYYCSADLSSTRDDIALLGDAQAMGNTPDQAVNGFKDYIKRVYANGRYLVSDEWRDRTKYVFI
jgi:hypothetical protein